MALWDLPCALVCYGVCIPIFHRGVAMSLSSDIESSIWGGPSLFWIVDPVDGRPYQITKGGVRAALYLSLRRGTFEEGGRGLISPTGDTLFAVRISAPLSEKRIL